MPERGKNDPAQMPFLIGATFLIGTSCVAIALWVAAASLLTMLH